MNDELSIRQAWHIVRDAVRDIRREMLADDELRNQLEKTLRTALSGKWKWRSTKALAALIEDKSDQQAFTRDILRHMPDTRHTAGEGDTWTIWTSDRNV